MRASYPLFCLLLLKSVVRFTRLDAVEKLTISNLVDMICQLCDVSRDSIVEIGPERTGKDMCYRLDCTQSYIDLGWSPAVSLKEGVLSMINWIESNLPALSKFNWSYVHRR